MSNLPLKNFDSCVEGLGSDFSLHVAALCMHIYSYACIYVCIYVCMYIYIHKKLNQGPVVCESNTLSARPQLLLLYNY